MVVPILLSNAGPIAYEGIQRLTPDLTAIGPQYSQSVVRCVCLWAIQVLQSALAIALDILAVYHTFDQPYPRCEAGDDGLFLTPNVKEKYYKIKWWQNHVPTIDF